MYPSALYLFIKGLTAINPEPINTHSATHIIIKQAMAEYEYFNKAIIFAAQVNSLNQRPLFSHSHSFQVKEVVLTDSCIYNND
jgi:hypothetical protein